MTEYKFSEKRPHPGQYIEARYPDGEWYRVQYHYEWYGVGILENNDGDICEIDDEGDQMVWREYRTEAMNDEKVLKFNYEKAAKVMANHIILNIATLAPDPAGKHSPMSADRVKELYLFAKFMTKQQAAQAVFEELAKEKENKTESSAKKLARIILTNRGCTAYIDNDSWHIDSAKPVGWNNWDEQRQEVWYESECVLAESDDFPDLGVSWGYGILEALAHIVGLGLELG